MRFKAIIITLSILLTGCVATGPGGKKSLILLSSSQEVAIGAGMAAQVATTEKKLPDQQWQTYLNSVGQKIVSVSDRKDIKYHFTVIESDQLNAFAAPGGYIYFYTGLLKKMNSESELAAVMAHEISHVVARHGIKRLQKAMGVSLAYELVLGGGESSETLNAAISVGMGLLFANYSRANEREADDFGMTYMIRAGYNPNGMIGMFNVLAAAGGKSNSAFENLLSTHPETQERIANAKAQIASLNNLPSSLKLGKNKYQEMLKRLH